MTTLVTKRTLRPRSKALQVQEIHDSSFVRQRPTSVRSYVRSGGSSQLLIRWRWAIGLFRAKGVYMGYEGTQMVTWAAGPIWSEGCG